MSASSVVDPTTLSDNEFSSWVMRFILPLVRKYNRMGINFSDPDLSAQSVISYNIKDLETKNEFLRLDAKCKDILTKLTSDDCNDKKLRDFLSIRPPVHSFFINTKIILEWMKKGYSDYLIIFVETYSIHPFKKLMQSADRYREQYSSDDYSYDFSKVYRFAKYLQNEDYPSEDILKNGLFHNNSKIVELTVSWVTISDKIFRYAVENCSSDIIEQLLDCYPEVSSKKLLKCCLRNWRYHEEVLLLLIDREVIVAPVSAIALVKSRVRSSILAMLNSKQQLVDHEETQLDRYGFGEGDVVSGSCVELLEKAISIAHHEADVEYYKSCLQAVRLTQVLS